MPRGGRRKGTPGQAYPNRTDMQQPVRVAAGQPYGERQAQEAAQKAIPLPAATPAQAPSPPAPGSFGAFTRPTENPQEPLTAGLPVGAGPGPEAVRAPLALGNDDTLLAQLRGLYAKHPNSDLAALISQAERR